jgi:hypothetical protein
LRKVLADARNATALHLLLLRVQTPKKKKAANGSE